MILEKSMGNPFVWKVVVLSWGKLDAAVENEMLPEDQQMSEPKWLPNANHHHTSINKKRFCRLLLSYEIHWITCAVRHRMTDDQDQHKHTLSFLKSVLSFSKPQLSFQKIETPRIPLSIAVNFGCSSHSIHSPATRPLRCLYYMQELWSGCFNATTEKLTFNPHACPSKQNPWAASKSTLPRGTICLAD